MGKRESVILRVSPCVLEGVEWANASLMKLVAVRCRTEFTATIAS